MKDLTQEDFNLSKKVVDDIVDNTDISQIKNKMVNIIENYDEVKKRQFLVHLKFLNVLLNELM